ncbi:MAG: hypothetical protein KIT16_13865 [Rhodospirillaceae bacterium]|nr:hypothetical protein [Rhodospirillaceae bacterium]
MDAAGRAEPPETMTTSTGSAKRRDPGFAGTDPPATANNDVRRHRCRQLAPHGIPVIVPGPVQPVRNLDEPSSNVYRAEDDPPYRTDGPVCVSAESFV